MTIHLYLAPAAGGKTTYLVDRARAWTANQCQPRVVVPTQLQVRAWQRRLAQAGGALGVHVGTFDALYRHILQSAGELYVQLGDPVQYRLLRLLALQTTLLHYGSIKTTPGFVREVLRLIRELKAGGVFPEQLLQAIQSMGGNQRLQELAELYLAYQRRLQDRGWADAAGIGWLASEALQWNPQLGCDWPCVWVDGFDDMTTVQLSVLAHLAGRVQELIVTLTGSVDLAERPQAHRRFLQTRQRLERGLNVQAEPLPNLSCDFARSPALIHLEKTLFTTQRDKVPAQDAVHLVAVPDRQSQVREALRWLKVQIVECGYTMNQVALLARDMEPYRPYVRQIASEFVLPIHLTAGIPLRHNPAVVSILDLLSLTVPADRAFPWRKTVEAWRSPYFSWDTESDLLPHISPHDAEMLDKVARLKSVVAGIDQWRQAFASLIDQGEFKSLDEEAPRPPTGVPVEHGAQELGDKFERFVQRVMPPQGEHTCRDFVQWLEALIGNAQPPEQSAINDLGVLRRVLDGPPELRERDIAALNAFKDVLRGLVWAEESLACAPMSFERFLDDLIGAVNTTVYRLPMPADREAVLASDVGQARGLVFRAVAVLGLSEGEFPAALVEDPLLRDADRRRLRDEFGLALDLSTQGSEACTFYGAVTRASDALFLARSRIADNGAPWQASPYWQEVQHHTTVQPLRLTTNSLPAARRLASWPELLLYAASYQDDLLLAWAQRQDVFHRSYAALERAAQILDARLPVADAAPSAYDGDLSALHSHLAQRYGPGHIWSASRLESYRTCPFLFFVSSVLHLAPRLEPVEGLDMRQVGNLYHQIMEKIYKAVEDPANSDQLLAALPAVAGKILDEAPQQEQFRETAWWAQTRQELIENVRRSLIVLDLLRGPYLPYGYELEFGIDDQSLPAVTVQDESSDDSFLLRGFIDRVDRTPDGRIRIIDYKTGGYSSYSEKKMRQGLKLQLGLYAWAAERGLGLGLVDDGFYWHVRQADWHLENATRKVWFTLAKAGAQEMIDTALAYAWTAVRGVRCGEFNPCPPVDGCPNYCPAAAFCWRYRSTAW